MKITLAVIGKTADRAAADGIAEYARRITRYLPFEVRHINDVKSARGITQAQQKQIEGRGILAAVDKSDHVALLDEKGRQMTSVEFAEYIGKHLDKGTKRIVFVVGGPYGFSDDVYARADSLVSLSKMTFPHDLARLIFAEQLYRAMTILNHEPYHHQ